MIKLTRISEIVGVAGYTPAHSMKKHRKREARRAKGAGLAITIVTVLTLAIVGGINYQVDNHGLLSDHLDSNGLKEYVEELRKAPVGVPYTFNDRSVKLLMARDSVAKCLAIGSSHIMTLRRDRNEFVASQCASLENVGVTGASFEDVITLLGIALKNEHVKAVIVGVDLWTLIRNSRPNWRRNSAELLAARESFGLPKDAYSKIIAAQSADEFTQLFSLSYLRVNYKFVKRWLSGKTTLLYDSRPLAEADLRNERALRADGSLTYPGEYQPTPDSDDLGTTDQWIKPPFYDPVVLAELEQALQKFMASGKRVILFLGPYHPYVVHECPKPLICDGIKVVDPLVRDLAKRLNVPLFGGFDPTVFGLESDDFIDFQHIRGPTGWAKLQVLLNTE